MNKLVSFLPKRMSPFYEEHGWYVSKKVVPDEVIDEAIAGSQRYYRGERDMQLPVNGGYSDWKPGDGDTIRNNTALQSRQLRKLALQPVIRSDRCPAGTDQTYSSTRRSTDLQAADGD
jgi:hypothetical protein